MCQDERIAQILVGKSKTSTRELRQQVIPSFVANLQHLRRPSEAARHVEAESRCVLSSESVRTGVVYMGGQSDQEDQWEELEDEEEEEEEEEVEEAADDSQTATTATAPTAAASATPGKSREVEPRVGRQLQLLCRC